MLTDFFHKPLAESRGDPLSCVETTVHEDGLLIRTAFSQLQKQIKKQTQVLNETIGTQKMSGSLLT